MIIIPEQQPPRGMPADVKQKLYWMELIHRAEVKRAADVKYQAVLWRDLLN